MSILEKIVSVFRSKVLKTAQSWNALVASVADGRADPAQVADALLAAGKEPAQLQADVERLQKRRAAQAELARIQKLEATTPEIEKQISTADAEFAIARKKHHDATNPLHERLRWIQGLQEQAANNIRPHLERGCSDPEALAAVQEAEAEKETAAASRASARAEFGRLKHEADCCHARIDNPRYVTADEKENETRYREQAAAIEASFPELDAAFTAAADREITVRQKLALSAF